MCVWITCLFLWCPWNSKAKHITLKKMIVSMIQTWQWTIIQGSYWLLGEINWSCTFQEFQIKSPFLQLSLHKIPHFSYSVFVISALVQGHSQVNPMFPLAAPTCSQAYHNHSHGTLVAVIRDSSYSEGRPECPAMVQYSPDIDASTMFILHILSDTPGGFQRLKSILLMNTLKWFNSSTNVYIIQRKNWNETGQRLTSCTAGNQLLHEISLMT